MRKLLATLLLVLFMPSIAIAQENRAGLANTINTDLPTNGHQLITASELRGVLNTMIASITAIFGDANVVPNTVLAQMPSDTVKANVTGGTANASDVTLSSFFGSAPVNSIPADAVIGASLGPDPGFQPGGSYAQLAVTSASARVALPTGTTVIIYNLGSAAAYVKLGNSSVVATTSDDVIQPNSWLALVVTTNVDLAAITATGTANLNISGGSGLPTGAGGGSSGGTGLSVTDGAAFTASTSPFTPGGCAVTATTLTSGQQGMVACGTNRSLHTIDDNSATMNTALASILTGVTSSIPAGTAVIGAANTVTTNNANTIPHICGSHVFKHITTATDTQIVAASGSTTIYVCDYSFSFGGTGNAYLEKATTGTCATLTQLTGTWYGAANVGKIDANPYYRGLNTGASAQLCVNTSQSVSFDIDVYYDQVLMALAIDNFDNAASGSGVSTLVLGTRLNGGGGMTLVAGDILLIHVATSDPTALRTVSSITDTTASLAWAQRGANSMTGGQFSAHVGGELWWAYFGAGGSGFTATVHLSAATDCVAASIIAVKGFSGTAYHTAPFDVHAGLPVTATSTTTTVPGAAVSTTAGNAMLIGAGALSANSVAGVGAGYTNSSGGLFILNGGSTDGVGTVIQQQVVSSPQSSVADNLNATTSNGWVWISDALAQGVTGLHQIPSMGFG